MWLSERQPAGGRPTAPAPVRPPTSPFPPAPQISHTLPTQDNSSRCPTSIRCLGRANHSHGWGLSSKKGAPALQREGREGEAEEGAPGRQSFSQHFSCTRLGLSSLLRFSHSRPPTTLRGRCHGPPRESPAPGPTPALRCLPRVSNSLPGDRGICGRFALIKLTRRRPDDRFQLSRREFSDPDSGRVACWGQANQEGKGLTRPGRNR